MPNVSIASLLKKMKIGERKWIRCDSRCGENLAQGESVLAHVRTLESSGVLRIADVHRDKQSGARAINRIFVELLRDHQQM